MEIELISEKQMEERYDDMLDECNPEVFSILPSRILFECDPIMYDCGQSDYESGLSEEGIMVEGSGDYYECETCWKAYDDEAEAKECCAEEKEEVE